MIYSAINIRMRTYHRLRRRRRETTRLKSTQISRRSATLERSLFVSSMVLIFL